MGKDAAYWAARRAKQKQDRAESGKRQRPSGRAPANMRWDDAQGWVRKDDAVQAPAATVTMATSAAVCTAAPATSAASAVAPAASAAAHASTEIAAATPATTTTTDLHALNESLWAAESIASTAAEAAEAAAAAAGVALCYQYARVAVWSEDNCTRARALTDPRWNAYEARCRATAHASWATWAAAVHSLDLLEDLPEDHLEEEVLAVKQFTAAAVAPLDVSQRQLAGKHYRWLLDEMSSRGAELSDAFFAVKAQWTFNRQPPALSALAWKAGQAATGWRAADGGWDGTEYKGMADEYTGLPVCAAGTLRQP